MAFANIVKAGIEIVMHPEKARKAKIKAGAAMKMYYALSVVPFVFASVLGMAVFLLLLAAGVPLATPFGLPFAGTKLVAIALGILIFELGLFFWAIVPVGLLLVSGLYQIIGGSFGFFEGSYSDTLISAVFGVMTPLLFAWVFFVPVIGPIVVVLAFMWGTYVMLANLAARQKTSLLKAFAVWLISSLIVSGLFFVILFVGLLSGALPYS